MRKNMYGNCRCKDKNGHICGWVTLLYLGIDNYIISRNWPIDYGVYNVLTHKLLQKYILPDYIYDLSTFESEISLIDFTFKDLTVFGLAKIYISHFNLR